MKARMVAMPIITVLGGRGTRFKIILNYIFSLGHIYNLGFKNKQVK